MKNIVMAALVGILSYNEVQAIKLRQDDVPVGDTEGGEAAAKKLDAAVDALGDKAEAAAEAAEEEAKAN